MDGWKERKREIKLWAGKCIKDHISWENNTTIILILVVIYILAHTITSRSHTPHTLICTSIFVIMMTKCNSTSLSLSFSCNVIGIMIYNKVNEDIIWCIIKDNH